MTSNEIFTWLCRTLFCAVISQILYVRGIYLPISSVKYWDKYSLVRRTSYFCALRSSHMFAGPLFQIKLHLLSAVLLVGLQRYRKLWNPLSKTVPGKFHQSVGHNKDNCWEDWAKFHRSRAWQIVLISNTAHLLWWPNWQCGIRMCDEEKTDINQ